MIEVRSMSTPYVYKTKGDKKEISHTGALYQCRYLHSISAGGCTLAVQVGQRRMVRRIVDGYLGSLSVAEIQGEDPGLRDPAQDR